MRCLLSILIMCWVSVATAQPVKVMSYNIRYDNPADGENAWPYRVSKVAEVIQKYGPDLIGMQEALHHQLEDLLRILPDYSYVGVGRDDGKTKGEYCAILYKHARFGLLNHATFWLSETPEVPGSKSWDAAITRIATWARVYDKSANQEFFILNTHFDHIGKIARAESAQLIRTRFMELAQSKPAIITGDFNCTADETAYQNLVAAGERAWFDSTQGMPIGTFCGFEVNAMECVPIDYIFHTDEWKTLHYQVISDNNGKHYPSDHLPVLVELERM